MENEPNYQFALRTSPGLIRWARQAKNLYSYGRGVLGGSSSGEHSARDVAEYIFRHAELTRIDELRALGWRDVISELKVFQIQNEKNKLIQLRQEATDLSRFIAEHGSWDYWRFRHQIYDDLKKSCGDSFNEADVSVRRMHYAALHALDSPSQLKEIKKEIRCLEKSLENEIKKVPQDNNRTKNKLKNGTPVDGKD